MRILFLADRICLRGGADHYFLQMMHYASSLGHRLEVAAGRIEASESLPAGTTHHRIRGLASSWDSDKGLGGLDELAAEFDVIHLQNIMNPTAIRVATRRGRSVVTVQDHRVFCPGMGKTMPDGSRCTTEFTRAPCSSCLGDDAYRETMIELTKKRNRALKNAHLVVLSQFMADELQGAGLQKSEIVPPWVASFPDREHPGSSLLLGGRLVAHKGILTAWTAWDRVGRPLPLRIAGAGPLEEQLEASTRLGWLSQEALIRELSQARALLLPSFWQEPFGILGLQALAVGTPVVVTDSGGTSDWSHAGTIKIPAGDSKAFGRAIERLADDPDLALRLGREGQAMVRETFGIHRCASKLEGIWAAAADLTPM